MLCKNCLPCRAVTESNPVLVLGNVVLIIQVLEGKPRGSCFPLYVGICVTTTSGVWDWSPDSHWAQVFSFSHLQQQSISVTSVTATNGKPIPWGCVAQKFNSLEESSENLSQWETLSLLLCENPLHTQWQTQLCKKICSSCKLRSSEQQQKME